MVRIVNNLPKVAAAFRPVLSQVVRKTAMDIVVQAQDNAPVDTGFLKNSLYMVAQGQSTYGDVGNPAVKEGKHGLNKIDSYVLPEIVAPGDDLTAYAAVGANYGVYVETGTKHAAAQPFLGPAVEAVRPAFIRALIAIEEKLREAI